jgi:hypothetical protein
MFHSYKKKICTQELTKFMLYDWKLYFDLHKNVYKLEKL